MMSAHWGTSALSDKREKIQSIKELNNKAQVHHIDITM